VDLGGGTGNFTALLARAAGILPLEDPAAALDGGGGGVEPMALCVDPSQVMLQLAARADAGIATLLDDALSFSRRRAHEGGGDASDRANNGSTSSSSSSPSSSSSSSSSVYAYDVVLLKEVVHHIPEREVGALYAGLHAQLAAGGLALTITRPQLLDHDYPLFHAAREVWRRNQCGAEVYAGAMERAGFHPVEVLERCYTFRVPTRDWLAMVRSRFWSTLAAEHFTDAQLAAGVKELEDRFKGQDEVVLKDKLLFLVGRKPL